MNKKILVTLIAIINITFSPLFAQDAGKSSLSKRDQSIAKGLMLSQDQQYKYFKLGTEQERAFLSLSKSLTVSERSKALEKVKTDYYKEIKQLLNKEQYDRFVTLQNAIDAKAKKSLEAKSRQSQKKLNSSVRKTGNTK